MKDKRNCNLGYPIYPPTMMGPMPMPINQNNYLANNSVEQQLNNINQQLSLLEQRVNRLESLNNSSTTNNYTKYNDSNYYMV